ncbi:MULTISPECIES: hypothetical protein [Bacillaceae]|uniref:DUF4352 domain-containing protein n=1 Tax=Evansella alkalicola TaxID=745819 RepID=A0ABS6JPU1_9BACI|nr:MULTISPECIES: hypothetical protein [Bacillaceae]MBU9720578.1 hypothetical protein [Bacillus alkalicola]
MNRIKVAALGIILMLGTIVACENQTQRQEMDNISINEVSFSDVDYENFLATIDDYIGGEIEFTGKVFYVNEEDEKKSIHVLTNIEGADNPMMVVGENLDANVEHGDYVSVTGTINGTETVRAQNGESGEIPVVKGDSVNKIDYIEAVSPTEHSVVVNQGIEQFGLLISVEKVEYSDDETRVFVHAENSSEDDVFVRQFSSEFIQNGNTYESVSLERETGYAHLTPTIRPGEETNGVIVFPPVDKGVPEASFIIEGALNDLNTELEPFEFLIRN